MANHYRSERDALLRRAQELGWTVTRNKKGYFRAQAPRQQDAMKTTVIWPATPSGYRTTLNKRKEMERIDPRLRADRKRGKVAAG